MFQPAFGCCKHLKLVEIHNMYCCIIGKMLKKVSFFKFLVGEWVGAVIGGNQSWFKKLLSAVKNINQNLTIITFQGAPWVVAGPDPCPQDVPDS